MWIEEFASPSNYYANRNLYPPCNLQASNEHLEEDANESLTTDELARRVKLSPAHFRALFRRDLNTTPKRFAKQLKMENAIRLAEDSPLTVSQIIEVVGGGDESHFQRQFKKTSAGLSAISEGFMPNRWRQNNWGKSRSGKTSVGPEPGLHFVIKLAIESSNRPLNDLRHWLSCVCSHHRSFNNLFVLGWPA